jgi:hypothetical protein
MLGIFSKLTLANLFLAHLLMATVICSVSLSKKSSFDINRIKANFEHFIIRDKIILFLFSLALSFIFVKILFNLVNPPFGWDSLNYHFTFAVEWLKNGNLVVPPTVFDDPSPTYYPINGSLYYLWLIFPLRNVLMADLGQLPFFLLSFVAVFSISRKIGLDSIKALFCSFLFIMVPNLFKQLQVAYVDVMVASLFLVSLNYLLALRRDFSALNAILYSLSTGLMIGTKTLALPYSILLLIPFIYLYAKNFKKIYLLFICIGVIFIFGGFSYLRNYTMTGNPIYPLNLVLSGKTIFKGVMDSSIYRVHFKADDYALSKAIFHEGLGAQTLLFVFPSVFIAPLFFLIKKKKEGLFLFYFSVLPVFIYLIYRYIIPLANLRYLYSLLAIGIILAFYLMDNLRIPQRVTKLLVLICAVASIAELAKHKELFISLSLSALVFLLLLSRGKRILPFFFKKGVFFGAIIISTMSLVFINNFYNEYEYPGYLKTVKYSGFWPDAARGWGWLNENTHADNIAYAGRPVPFPLYGTNFKNNVYYVSINETDPAYLHYFKDSSYRWGYDFESLHRNLGEKGNYRGNASYSRWLSNITRRGTDFLFIYSLHQTKQIDFPVEDAWAEQNPDKFKLVFSNDTVHIYKIAK